MNAIRVRPVGFDRDNGKSFLGNKPFRDQRAFEIKFVGAMRSFTKKDKSRIADKIN